MGVVFGNLFVGFVLEYILWKWVFVIMGLLVVIVIVVVFFILLVLNYILYDEGVMVKNLVDWLGVGLVIVGLLVLFFVLI